MQEHFPDCKIVGTESLRQASGRGRGADEPLFPENPQVYVRHHVQLESVHIGEYLIGHNMKNFKLIGYDLLHRNVSCLKEGAVDFLIAQQPTAQGYSVEPVQSPDLQEEVKQLITCPSPCLRWRQWISIWTHKSKSDN